MTQLPSTLAALLAPMSEAEFFRDYYEKKPLHIKGAVQKFAGVCGWPAVSAMVSQNGIWTAASLELALEGKKLDAAAYCRPGQDRDNRANQLVDLEAVKHYLQRGASLVLNDVTTLSPGIASIAALLGEAFKAHVQSNLYCSWQSWQGFSTHYDLHDVWAVHLEGRKFWNIYGKHFENPIPHPKFRGLGADFHKAHHGAVTAKITLEPGDLLYIPRGWYHDALAQSEATMHLSFGVTPLIGLDALTQLFESAIEVDELRANLPRDERDMPKALSAMADKVATLMRSEAFLKRMLAVQKAHHPLIGRLELPVDAVPSFAVSAKNISVFEQAGKVHLGAPGKSAPLPPEFEAPVRWILDNGKFSEPQLAQAFPSLADTKRHELLKDLQAMKVLAVA